MLPHLLLWLPTQETRVCTTVYCATIMLAIYNIECLLLSVQYMCTIYTKLNILKDWHFKNNRNKIYFWFTCKHNIENSFTKYELNVLYISKVVLDGKISVFEHYLLWLKEPSSKFGNTIKEHTGYLMCKYMVLESQI